MKAIRLLMVATTLLISGCGSGSTNTTSAALVPTGPGPCGTAKSPPSRYEHVVWVVMENHDYSQIIGSPDAPYVDKLAAQCGLAANYKAVSHPSLPNYIAMRSGGTHGISN